MKYELSPGEKPAGSYEELARRMHQAIDFDLLKEVEADHPDHRLKKYFEPANVATCANRVQKMGLIGARSHSVLDLGCALGHFPLALWLSGHPCVGVDEKMPIITAASKAIPFNYVPYLVKRSRKFKNFKKKFDLVTACGVNFGYHDTNYWGAPQYAFFAKEIFTNHLSEQGWAKIVLMPNRGENTDFLFDPKTWVDVTNKASIRHGVIELRRPS